MRERNLEISEDLLWENYLSTSDGRVRTLLIQRYTKIVKKISAVLFAKRTDDEIEFDDYFQFGMIGLIESIDRFMPDKGASFETFASYRIKGAILNGIEISTEKRSQIAFRSRLKRERIESIATSSDRRPALFEEMVELTLGIAISVMLDDTGLVEDQNEYTDDTSYSHSEIIQLKHLLLNIVSGLPERERKIIEYHYFHQTSFESIATILDVSKGRISQLHKRALEMIKDKLNERSMDDYY
ncbi:sigma-70 family RNA polymerase sigma factor [Marinobacterium sp. D7]|uniref:sigma-70 family RNA polymerase sigma factor n=1 Tax=Marinobacterium ramblicola TaxID=2849041 RepID=UPI001C2D6719|nr:sigma-70 family RNA polymerase sigma factor [Marinobacterium ramblicola]MBV1787713.1 sigma-70 family RNA polymerase sigma factor [Marinobacterium ramblicola]